MIDKLESEIDMMERHLTVLRKVIESEPIGIVSLSRELEYPQHRVRYSLRILEEEQLIEPTSKGAVPVEGAAEFLTTYQDQIDEIIDRLGDAVPEKVPAPSERNLNG